jgi:hypothetical protein
MPTGAAAKTSHTVTPRPDGSFEFEGVFPGNYIVDLDSRPLFASGPVEITVRDADIRGIQLAIAGSRSVPVRPVMEGGGAVPFPRLALMTNSGATGLEVNVVADRTGRISVVLPEVESRIGIPSSALPAGYTVKSMTYGSTDLLRSPLKISPSDTDELHVTFAAAPNASFKVSGNVVGFDKVRSASRNWNARITGTPLTQFGAADTVLAPVRPDGSFEFPGLWPGDYDIRLSPDPQGTLGAKITVSDRDISNVRIVTPGSRQVTAHVFIEGDAPIPDFRLTATPKFGEGVAVWFNVRGNPDKRSDLVATPPLAIPLGEQRITIDMPHGYTLKSITYRGADVTRGTAQFSASDTDELRISFAFDASRAFRIAGRIVGMENLRPEMQQGPDGTAPRSPLIMTLSDRARGAALLTTPVNGDGSFEFPRVVQGDYTLTSAPPGVTRGATPDVQITVSDRDVTGLELRVPPVDAR